MERNASPQPPPGAVVESPARSQYTGFEAPGYAGADDAAGRKARKEKRILVVAKGRSKVRVRVVLVVLVECCSYTYMFNMNSSEVARVAACPRKIIQKHLRTFRDCSGGASRLMSDASTAYHSEASLIESYVSFRVLSICWVVYAGVAGCSR